MVPIKFRETQSPIVSPKRTTQKKNHYVYQNQWGKLLFSLFSRIQPGVTQIDDYLKHRFRFTFFFLFLIVNKKEEANFFSCASCYIRIITKFLLVEISCFASLTAYITHFLIVCHVTKKSFI